MSQSKYVLFAKGTNIYFDNGSMLIIEIILSTVCYIEKCFVHISNTS